MVTAHGEERGLATPTLRDLETEYALIKRDGPFEVGHLQVNVANSDFLRRFAWLLRIGFQLYLRHQEFAPMYPPRNRQALRMPSNREMEYFVYIRLGERPRSHLQAVVKWGMVGGIAPANAGVFP